MEIILIRHGKPSGATNPKLSAQGFAGWVENYNRCSIAADSLPPTPLQHSLSRHFIVSSPLPRAINSAYLCVNKTPDLMLNQLREMEIPVYKLPFTLTVNTWLVVNRLCWLVGFNGQAESFTAARIRAKQAAEKLQGLANQHHQVGVFGHGLVNQYIAKELRKLGWQCTTQGKGYWSVIKLTC